jgi:hypothetical protein
MTMVESERDKLGSNSYPRTDLLPRHMLSGYSVKLYGVILSRSKRLWKRQREPLTIACQRNVYMSKEWIYVMYRI